MLFKRDIEDFLATWKANKSRKPLILRGARQVGKTTVVERFAHGFRNFVKLNLEIPSDAAAFRRGLTAGQVIEAIQLQKNIALKPGASLLFIDEIQACPEAIALLRYFYEEYPDLHVIAAGSLLQTVLSDPVISFPVGRTEHAHMYPLSFHEYLRATGNGFALDAYEKVPGPESAFGGLMELFHTYVKIGGMPEIVARHIEGADTETLRSLYQDLVIAFVNDVPKYARNPTLARVMRHCIEAGPHAAGERIKFEGFGQSNYKSRE
ncbi:MAG: AAA family ATPase, partial [Chitinivibrionales bacterium]|nr:AAA family ATPase [Chitinivibrionales bacterium]